EPEQVNLFATAATCDPEPETNRVFVDVPSNSSSHLTILNDGDQTVTLQDNVGPANDQRRAAEANGSYMNFGITENYLGKPCNDPRAMKLCVAVYDDPTLSGAPVGPAAYATHDAGRPAIYPAARPPTLPAPGARILP